MNHASFLSRSLDRARSLAVGASIVLLVTITIGCGGNGLSSVTGIVKLDGQSIDGGSVTFTPLEKGPLAYADVHPDGTYELQSAGAVVGVRPGKYTATVSHRSGIPSFGMTIAQIEALELVPIRYTQPQTSDLQVTVESGSNEINLELTKN